MITSSECFKKRMKSNICTLFNALITGVIIFLPIIVFVAYWFTLPPVKFDMFFDRINILLFGGFISSLINAVYAWIFAFPFLKCYYKEDDLS